MESLEQFEPEVVHVFSLHGISKSLLFKLRGTNVPVVYDVFDHWLSAGVREDPWLRFWNSPALPLLSQSTRAALEMSGERGRLDGTAPTRMMKGYDRLPALFAEGKARAEVGPNSIGGFPFDHIYFCSRALKELTVNVGFCVQHAEVIYPGITAAYVGDIKRPGTALTKFLIVSRLTEESGVMTALKALKIAREAGLKITLSVYGHGESKYVAGLRSYVVAHQLPVEFLNVSNLYSDLPAVYKQHDALLHTPEWAEPFPFTPLEAMGCGLPVIASTPGGTEESAAARGELADVSSGRRGATGGAHPGIADFTGAALPDGGEGAGGGAGAIQRHDGDRPGGEFPGALANADDLKTRKKEEGRSLKEMRPSREERAETP